MASQKARDLWKQLKDEDRENRICIECNSANPQWASVSYGIFFCLECSGVHRSLGVHLSFVRSLTMDSWSDRQLAMMQAGGNSKAKAFFKAHGVDGMGIKEKYATKAAAQLREKVLVQVEGRAFEDDKKETSPQSRTPPPSQAREERPKQPQRDELDDWLDEKPQKAPQRSAPQRESSKKKEEIDFDWGTNKSSPVPERERNISRSSDRDNYSSSTSSRGSNSSYTNAPTRTASSTSNQSSYNTPPAARNYTSGNSYSSSENSYSSGNGYNGNNTERLAQFSNARAISSSDFYGDGSDSNKPRSGAGGYNSDSIMDIGLNLLSDGMSKLSAVASTAATKIGEQGREFSSKVQQKGLLTEVQDMSGKGWDYVSSYFNQATGQPRSSSNYDNSSGARQGGGGYGGYGGGGSGGGYNSSSSSMSWEDDRHDRREDRYNSQSPQQQRSYSNGSRNNSDRDLLGDEDTDNNNTTRNNTRKANGAGSKNSNTQQQQNLIDDDWSWDNNSSSKKSSNKQQDDEDSGSNDNNNNSSNNNNDEDEWVWKDDDSAKKNVRKTAVAKKKPVASTGNSDGSWDGW